MDLKEFVKTVLVEVDAGVEEAGKVSHRYIKFTGKDNARTVEFDIAVTAETSGKAQGGAKIKVWQMADIGGKGSKETRNSTASRITFGVEVSERTKTEQDKWETEHKAGIVTAHKPTKKKLRLHV